jgi:Ser/Thr protein kinase RdoA (MazF antagonist)
VKELLVKWGSEFRDADISSLQDGVWRVQVGDQTYILKHRDTRTRVWEEYNLLTWLTEQGHPISPLLYTTEGLPWAEYQLGIYVLYRFVEGTPGDELNSCSPEFAREAGSTLARLHQALAAYDAGDAFPTFDLFHEVASFAWPTVQGYAAQRFGHTLHALKETIEGELVNPYESLPRQLIHRDFHPANLIFRGNKIAGILDFDRVRLGVRLFDLCYLATAVLSEVFDDPNKRSAWLSFVQELIAGYHSVQPMERTEGYAFLCMAYLIQVLFAAYFLDAGNIGLADRNLAMLMWLYDQQEFLQPVIEKMVAG